MQANSVTEREQLLDQLVECERRLGLAWTEGEPPNQRFLVHPTPLARVQSDLKPDEVLLEDVLDDPNSFCVAVSRTHTYVRPLPLVRSQVETLTQRLVNEVRA